MSNCTCRAYSFPHRRNGGDCQHDGIVEIVEDTGLDFADADAALIEWGSVASAINGTIDYEQSIAHDQRMSWGM